MKTHSQYVKKQVGYPPVYPITSHNDYVSLAYCVYHFRLFMSFFLESPLCLCYGPSCDCLFAFDRLWIVVWQPDLILPTSVQRRCVETCYSMRVARYPVSTAGNQLSQSVMGRLQSVIHKVACFSSSANQPNGDSRSTVTSRSAKTTVACLDCLDRSH